MKKIFIALSLIAASLTAWSQSGLSPYELNVGDFHELKVVDHINVEYICNPEMAGKVAFEASPEVASAIIFEPNNKGKLEVKLATREIEYENLPTVRVYSNYLTKVENDGDSTVLVASIKEGPKLDVKLVGNGKLNVKGVKTVSLNVALNTGKGSITVEGSANDAKLSLTGTGTIDATELLSKNVNAKLLGTGWIKCWAIDRLDIKGMGTGTVSYKGRPEVFVKALKIKVNKLEPAAQ